MLRTTADRPVHFGLRIAAGLSVTAALTLLACSDPTNDGSATNAGGPEDARAATNAPPPIDATQPNLPPPTGASSSDEHPLVASFSGFRGPKPASWQWQPTTMTMRAGTWTVPGESGETHASLVAFSGIGGGRDMNISRWAGQMRTADQRTMTPEVIEVEMEAEGFNAVIVDMTGEYRGMGAAAFDVGQRFLGAIIETPGAPVQLRLTGPEAVVTRQRDAFFELVRGLRMSGDFPLPPLDAGAGG
ncbi:MAG: hypothetical protein AB8G96_05230 [Phycisphaerales bacterium]